MNMVELMWLFCGALIGGWITLFFTAAVSGSKEEELIKENNDLLKEVKTLRAILTKEGTGEPIKWTCPRCGCVYDLKEKSCLECGCKVAMRWNNDVG